MKAVRFSPSIEIEAEREADLTREILERMAAAQAANSDKHRHAIRDAHAKSHAILKANLTLRIEPQDGHTPARRNYGDDILSFNPWNGVQAHQPLGSIMRIRKPAYERSSAFRHHQNALGRLEPDSLAQIPD